MNLVLTCLLNNTPDPQRGRNLPADRQLVAKLAESIPATCRLVVLTDCLDEGLFAGADYYAVVPGGNPYFYRWQIYADFIDRCPGIDRVWCVDATDVDMLRDPFPHMSDGVLYIGSEASTVGCPWMVATNPSLGDWIAANGHRMLLNPGLVGGTRPVVHRFAEQCAAHADSADMTDMGIANKVAWDDWLGQFVTGRRVHTPYKAYADDNGVSWWRHK